MRTVHPLFMLASVSLLATACLKAHPVELGAAAGAGPVTCDSNCTMAWERAQFWVAKHGAWKIQSATNILIQTYNPPEHDTRYGISVMKEPLEGGRYTIKLALYCANWIRCDPRAADVAAAFNHYVATGVDILDTAKHGSAIK